MGRNQMNIFFMLNHDITIKMKYVRGVKITSIMFRIFYFNFLIVENREQKKEFPVLAKKDGIEYLQEPN